MRLFLSITGALALSAAGACAAENAYDVLGKVLKPIITIFLEETNNSARALAADMTLLEMTKLPPQFKGSKVALTIENPDKLILRGPVLGEPVTLCRNGQEIWGFPGTKLQSMIDQLGELPKRKKKFKLERFSLPFPEQQLVFLPILFQVRDEGEQDLNGISCRVLDVGLMPQLAKSLEVEGWMARAWIRADYTIAKLQVGHPGWQIIVGMDRVQFRESFPTETWQPNAAEASDVLKLDPPQFKQILDAATAKGKLP
jgi:hypothetical protein